MLDTYKATLKGNYIKWTDDRPFPMLKDQEIEVLITFLDEISKQPAIQVQRGEQMARCLEKIANTGGIVGIADPVEWQREIRKDRHIYPE